MEFHAVLAWVWMLKRPAGPRPWSQSMSTTETWWAAFVMPRSRLPRMAQDMSCKIHVGNPGKMNKNDLSELFCLETNGCSTKNFLKSDVSF